MSNYDEKVEKERKGRFTPAGAYHQPSIILPDGCWDKATALRAQECIDRASEFYDDIMPQVSGLVIQDYHSLNKLGLLLQLLKSKGE